MRSLLRYVFVGLLCFAAGLGAAGFMKGHQSNSYAGLGQREIKALSAEDVAGLRGGKGMGYALAAELNGYPGPRHVLELADKLALTTEQRAETEELFAKMKMEVSSLGNLVVETEKTLDQGFAQRTLDPQSLQQLTDKVSKVEGTLRGTHLYYHLAMMKVLTPEQVTAYVKLRGYAGGAHTGH
jgi:Spy/CpxP family protein refolding chaperone